MKNKRFQKISIALHLCNITRSVVLFLGITVICSAVVLGIASFGRTEKSTGISNRTMDDFNAFSNAVRQMPANESSETFVASVQGASYSSDESIESPKDAFASKRLIMRASGAINTQGAVSHASGFDNYHVLQYATEEQAREAYNYYNSLSGVKYVVPDIEMTPDIPDLRDRNIRNSPYMSESSPNADGFLSWGARTVGAKNYQQYLESLNELNEVVVAVIDTGLDISHGHFAGRIAEGGRNFWPASYWPQESDADYEDFIDWIIEEFGQDVCDAYLLDPGTLMFDPGGHGTHVAGTIVDLTLPNVKILPIATVGSGSGQVALSSSILAIEYVAMLQEERGNIVSANMSWGIGVNWFPNDLIDMGLAGVTKAIGMAIDTLYAAGTVPVAAAGNQGMNSVRFSAPPNLENVLVVSAVGKQDDIPWLNSRGTGLANFSTWGELVDIAAPGVDILSAIPNSWGDPYYGDVEIDGNWYATMSGTSMASPHVAAAVALLRSDSTRAYNSIQEIKDTLYFNARDAGILGYDQFYGHGILNVRHAYAEQINTPITFSRAQEEFTSQFDLSLSIAHQNTKIFYTLDNSAPTTGSIEYVEPITVDETTVVRAIAYVFDQSDKIIARSEEFYMIYFHVIDGKKQDIANAWEIGDIHDMRKEVWIPGYWKETEPGYWEEIEPGYWDTVPGYWEIVTPGHFETVPGYWEEIEPGYFDWVEGSEYLIDGVNVYHVTYQYWVDEMLNLSEHLYVKNNLYYKDSGNWYGSSEGAFMDETWVQYWEEFISTYADLEQEAHYYGSWAIINDEVISWDDKNFSIRDDSYYVDYYVGDVDYYEIGCNSYEWALYLYIDNEMFYYDGEDWYDSENNLIMDNEWITKWDQFRVEYINEFGTFHWLAIYEDDVIVDVFEYLWVSGDYAHLEWVEQPRYVVFPGGSVWIDPVKIWIDEEIEVWIDEVSIWIDEESEIWIDPVKIWIEPVEEWVEGYYGYKIVGEGILRYKGVLKEVEILEGTEVIGPGAFFGTTVESVILPESMTTIGPSAFLGAIMLKHIYAPEVTSIGYRAFLTCISLEQITDDNFPKLTEIGFGAFENCFGLELIYLSNITEIWGDEFMWTTPKLIILPNVTDIYGPLWHTSLISHVWGFDNDNTIIVLGKNIQFIKEETFIAYYEHEKVFIDYETMYHVYSDWDSQEICINGNWYDYYSGNWYDYNTGDAMDGDWETLWQDYLYEIGEWVIMENGDVIEIDWDNLSAFVVDRYLYLSIGEPEIIGIIPPSAIIYGYIGTSAETFALLNGNEFIAIDLEFIKDLTTEIIVIDGTPTISVEVQGYELQYQWYEDGVLVEGETNAYLKLNSSSNGKEYYVVITDWLSDSIESAKQTVEGLVFHTITVSAGANGQVSPSDTFEVYGGEDFTVMITITPNANYHVSSILVDAESVDLTEIDFMFENVTVNHTIYVTFAINTYTVTFKDWNGVTLKTETVAYGSAATAATNPDNKEGWHFTGWDTTFNNVTSSLIVTAQYEINKYTVTFKDHDGTELKVQTDIEHGSLATAPEDPTRANTAQFTYTFDSWDVAFDNITGSLIVTAVYTYVINSYTVTFKDWNSTTLKTETVEYGSAATAPASPTRDDADGFSYTFTGWNAEFDNVTTGLTITAVYNTTRISFNDTESGVIITGLELPGDAVLSVVMLTPLPENALGGFEIIITSETIENIELNKAITISFDINEFLLTHDLETFQVFLLNGSSAAPVSIAVASSSGSNTLLTAWIENGRLYFETDTLGSFYFTAAENSPIIDSIPGWFERNKELVIGIGAGVVGLIVLIVAIVIIRNAKRKSTVQKKDASIQG